GHPGRGAGTDAPATAVPIDIEALRQALPQLARLERYARRAFLRGDRAARRLAPISCYELERSTDEAEVELELRDNPRDTSRSCRAAKRSQIPSHIQCCSMKPASFEYARPRDLDKAGAMLAAGDDGRITAGGQPLAPLMAWRLARPKRLIDIARIGDLAFVRQERDGIAIGPPPRQCVLERDAVVRAA